MSKEQFASFLLTLLYRSFKALDIEELISIIRSDGFESLEYALWLSFYLV